MSEESSDFVVRLDIFEGPFDLLLQLISKHKLDVTEVALSQVTDEFIATVLSAGENWDLDKTSSFLVIAATLLDLKTARLLPQGEVEDAEDIAMLEARDLLFSRLLQYRAFKEVSFWLADTFTRQTATRVRPGGLEPGYTEILPEVEINITSEKLAQLAANALTPKPAQEITFEHLHSVKVSVREQATQISVMLKRTGQITFSRLTENTDRLTTVARFLALLEMFRQHLVSFDQLEPLAELTIRWTGDETAQVEVFDEYDAQLDLEAASE